MTNNANASAGAPLRLKAGADASAKRARLNLVNTTLFTRNPIRVNPYTGEIFDLPLNPPVSLGLIEYPDGGAELFAVERCRKSSSSVAFEDFSEENGSHPQLPAGNLTVKMDPVARSRMMACSRAKTKVRRICRYYQLHVMVTLTFPGEGIHNYDTALYCVQKFINDHGKCLHLGGVYVAVPELHPGGHGWHWHILIERKLTKEELNNLRWQWTLFLERKGICLSGDVKFARINVKAFKDAKSGAAYASKYIGKSFNGDQRKINRKRYLSSKRIKVPTKKSYAYDLEEVKKFISQFEEIFLFESGKSEDWLGPEILWASW